MKDYMVPVEDNCATIDLENARMDQPRYILELRLACRKLLRVDVCLLDHTEQ